MKKRIAALAMTVAMAMSLLPVSAFAADFGDTDGHWGKDSIDRWTSVGVLNGKGEGVFDPDGSMTRAEFAQMLANMLGYSKMSAAGTFGDVAADAWYADAILKLAAAGVMTGDGAGNANPNAQITREEAAVMLCRAFSIQPKPGASLDFADAGSVSGWARDAVATLAELGMMNGVGNNQVAPQLNINRASVATLVDNMVAEYVTENKTISGEVNGVVVVAADANVTLENATLEVPLVVAPKAEGAEVTLTGTTAASDVVVDAANAKVSVEKDAAVDNVSVAGDNANVAVAGKAETVAVEAANAKVEVAGTVSTVDVTNDAAGSSVNVNQGASVGSVTAGAANANVNVAQDATVDKVTVSGAGTKVDVNGTVSTVTVAEGANNATVSTGSTAKIDNVTTSAQDVKVSGTGTVGTVTADKGSVDVTVKDTEVKNEGADKATAGDKDVSQGDSQKVETTTPSGGGGGGGGDHQYAMTVTSSVVKGNGTVTLTNDKQDAPAEGGTYQDVTINVTPAAQTASALPYIVKEVKVTSKPAGSTVTDAALSESGGVYKFKPDKDGAYTVSVTFVQPILSGELFIAEDTDSHKKLVGYGYPDDVTDAQLAATPWLVLGLNHNKDTNEITGTTAIKENVVLKANGETVDLNTKNISWKNSLGKYSTAYVNTKNNADKNPSPDALGLTGSAYKFVLSFDYKDAHYEFNCNYTKPDVSEEDIINITFKTSTGKVIAEYPVEKRGQVTVPKAPAIDGYFFTGWDTVGVTSDTKYTVGDANATITANYVKVVPQTTGTRPDGPEGHGTPESSNFEYAKNYGEAGLTLQNNTLTVDATKLATFDVTKRKSIENAGHTAVVYGVEYTNIPDGATKAYSANSLENLAKSGTGLDLTQNGNNVYIDKNGNKHLISYVVVANVADNKVTPLATDKVEKDYVKWVKIDNGKEVVVGVTELTLNVKTVNKPVTVTFKNGDAVVESKSVAKGGTVTLPTTNPIKAGFTFAGWVDTSGNAFTATTKVNSDITVTPKWSTLAEIEALANLRDFSGWTGVPDVKKVTVTLGSKDTNGTIPVTGTLYKVENFTGFNGAVTREQSGWYAAIEIKAPSGTSGIATESAVIRVDNTFSANPVKVYKLTGDSDTLKMLIHVADVPTGGGAPTVGAQKVTVYANWNGGLTTTATPDNTSYKCVLDFSKVTLSNDAPASGA